MIKIVTDSTCDLPKELIEEHKIAIVPLKVHFGEETYLEGIDISSELFYEKLKAGDKLPTTSQPSPGDFVQVYQGFAQGGYTQIISIHISSKLSGTYQSAMIAKEMVKEQINVEVIDSQQVSMALGLLVLEACRLAKEERSIGELVATLDALKEKINIYFLVDTLEYLTKGGRIGKASSLIGSLLNIKPILTLNQGEVHPFEKVRGQAKALERLVEIASSQEKPPLSCAIVHGQATDTALRLEEKLKDRLNLGHVEISNIGAVVGTHVGPGAVGIILLNK